MVKESLAKLLKLDSGDGYIFHAENDSRTPAIFENLLRRGVFENLKVADVEWHGMHAFRRGLATVLHSIDGIGDRTIDHVLRHESKKDDVAGKHYIKPDLKQIRRVLERVETMYKAVEKKNKRRKR